MKKLIILSSILVSVILALTVGETFISPFDILSNSLAQSEKIILFELRIPRIIACIVIGASLSASGLLLQSFFRNPLACPSTVGVATFSAAGGMLVFGLISAAPTRYSFQLGSVLGALFAIVLLLFVARKFTNSALILFGLALSFIGSSTILILQYLADPSELARIAIWMLGGVNVIGISTPLIALSLSALIIIIICSINKELDLLSCGQDFALTRGVNVRRYTMIVMFCSGALVSIVVSLCGPIGFVGIVAPHVARSLCGGVHSKLIPTTISIGIVYLLLADTLTRVLPTPGELPLGVITSLTGGLLFIVIVFRSRNIA